MSEIPYLSGVRGAEVDLNGYEIFVEEDDNAAVEQKFRNVSRKGKSPSGDGLIHLGKCRSTALLQPSRHFSAR